MFRKILIGLWVLLSLGYFLVVPTQLAARETVTDWYIKDFKSEIVVNKDSSLNITEDIVADCGNLPNKHGIFRILPTIMYLSKNKKVNTPIKLESITDFNNNPLEYSVIKNNSDHIITWKIGDPNKTVSGVNNYRIKYKVSNAIRFDNDQFDEFYWNLNGNFWDIEIDQFSANIIFPAEMKNQDTEINLYSGKFTQKDVGLAQYGWINDHVLRVESNRILARGEGITASVTIPKKIVSPYTPGIWEKFSSFFYFLIPFFIFIICYLIWSKYGRDPKIQRTVVPEFSVPGNLEPMEMGVVLTNGSLQNKYISAGIVNLAVKKYLNIEKIDGKDYKLTRLDATEKLSESEILLLEKLFTSKKEIKISDLENKFYSNIPALTDVVGKKLKPKKLLFENKLVSGCVSAIMIAVGLLLFIISFSVWDISVWLGTSLILSIAIIVIFLFLISKRTVENVQMLKKIEGFKLYLTTAEKYRQEFNEKENIFEKYLPYAMALGVVSQWIKSFQKIYQEIHHKDYFVIYHPYWYAAGMSDRFDADLFSSNLESLSSKMSSTVSSAPSSSGSGGGGFSGGGGGGGGGGGW